MLILTWRVGWCLCACSWRWQNPSLYQNQRRVASSVWVGSPPGVQPRLWWSRLVTSISHSAHWPGLTSWWRWWPGDSAPVCQDSELGWVWRRWHQTLVNTWMMTLLALTVVSSSAQVSPTLFQVQDTRTSLQVGYKTCWHCLVFSQPWSSSGRVLLQSPSDHWHRPASTDDELAQ